MASATLQIAADARPEKIRYAAALATNASASVSHNTLKNSRWMSELRASMYRVRRARTIEKIAQTTMTAGIDQSALAGTAPLLKSWNKVGTNAEPAPHTAKYSPPAHSRCCDSAKMRSTISMWS